MRAEPKTLLRFLLEYFETLQDLFAVQQKNQLITAQQLNDICNKHNNQIQSSLVEYKILKEVNGNFEFAPVFIALLQFVLNEFKPMLPETIEKYNFSITQLFGKIQENIEKEKEVLTASINDMALEISQFNDMIEKNTTALLAETRKLKANLEKIDYREKVIRASRWIEEYIIPMNRILDINHTNSISNKLYELAHYANHRRLIHPDENIRTKFENLYSQLIHTNDGLLREAKILTNELLPLIERIRSESMILTGMILFLKKPYKTPTPPLLKTTRESIISKNMYLNTIEFFAQFTVEDNVYIEDENESREKWLFNKERYIERLQAQLPINNFFYWCTDSLIEEKEDISPDKFFALTSLLFEDNMDVEIEGENKIEIKTTETIIKAPVIKINSYGIS
jgi:hypothetical protein